MPDVTFHHYCQWYTSLPVFDFVFRIDMHLHVVSIDDLRLTQRRSDRAEREADPGRVCMKQTSRSLSWTLLGKLT